MESFGNVVESIRAEMFGRATVIGTLVASDSGMMPAECTTFSGMNCSGNGEFKADSQSARMSFTGSLGTYELRVQFGASSINFDGLTAVYRLDGWESIAYLAIGHTAGGAFRHIKIRHALQNEWQIASFTSEDLAFLVQNQFEAAAPAAVSDLRLYVKGTPSPGGAGISVTAACNWQSLASGLQKEKLVGREEGFRLSPAVSSCLTDYLRGTNESLMDQVRSFLDTGKFPIHGEIALEWGLGDSVPPSVSDNPTFRYIWHSLYPAAYMAIYALDCQDDTALHPARDLVVGWLRDNYYQASSDMRYAWYDHGTAERLIAFLLILDSFRQAGTDVRFIAQLEDAIRSHALLLESDSFYAANQNSRYHNHAWFQDIALMSAGISNPLPEGRRWIEKSKHRLSKQFEKLIVRDAGYAVFAENSIGYHHGVQSLVSLAGKLIELSGGSGDVANVASELDLWSQYLRYPDRRSPAQGDTFHLPNPTQTLQRARVPYELPEAKLLKAAGYGVVKGNHEGRPFMICFFATSRSKTHKHQDNLSLTLFFDGLEWLVDPSFYSHDYSDVIPAYLRSAWAHNTVALVGYEQSIEPGLVTLGGTATQSGFAFEGSHSAYSDVVVRRELSGSLTELDIRILDDISAGPRAHIPITGRTVFHVGEGVVPTKCLEGVILTHPNSEYRILLTCNVSSTIYYGLGSSQEETSVIGTSFGQYENSYSIHFAHQESEPLRVSLSALSIDR